MSRIPDHLTVKQIKDLKTSRGFETKATVKRFTEASLKDRPEGEASRLGLFVEVTHKEDGREDEIFLGHVTHFQDGFWSYLHADEDVRRGLFTTLYQATRRLIWAAVSGNEAEVAYLRVREVDQRGLAEHRQTHPAFGMLRFSRISVGGGGEMIEGGRLYGSKVRHSTMIQMTVARGSVTRDLGRDWHHAGETLVEVRMSQAQFAAAIGSMNAGQGNPCTVTQILGRDQPELPELPSLPELAMEDLGESVADIARRLDGMEKQINAAAKQLGKGRTKQMLDQLNISRDAIEGGFPFVRKQFAKSVEHTLADAKTELDASVAFQKQQIGQAVLDGRLPVQLGEEITRIPALPEVTVEDEEE